MKNGKGPTGKEIMKRPAPRSLKLLPKRFELDPKKAYSGSQLAEIGAISIKFTQLQYHIDFICSHIIFTKVPFWLKLSVDARLPAKSKLEVVEEALEHMELLDGLSKSAIKDTLTQFRAARSYRNAIVHHSTYDHAQGIGSFVDESRKAYQVMVSAEALTNLYALICALQEELQRVDLLFRIETDAQRPGTVDKATGYLTPFPTRQLIEQVIPGLRKELIALQKRRKSLPPLPKFPDADLVRGLEEEEARHSDPAETDWRPRN
jgi:hypothetical protein